MNTILILAAALAAQDAGEAREHKDATGKKLVYRLTIPPAGGKVPLMLFFHGAGERGDDNKSQANHVVPYFLKNQATNPCFVVAPQCPKNQQWVDVPWGAPKHAIPRQPSESMRLTIDLLAALQKEFPAIDPKRLYVCGLSMGGYATWDILARMPKTFAAAVPICGGADEAQAAAIAKVPIWVFHGGSDDVVPTQRSRNIVEALKKAGSPVKYTEFPGMGHGSWDPAFQTPELLPWIFAQKHP